MKTVEFLWRDSADLMYHEHNKTLEMIFNLPNYFEGSCSRCETELSLSGNFRVELNKEQIKNLIIDLTSIYMKME